MSRKFNVAEILESVDSIVSDNSYPIHNDKKIIDRYKKFLSNNTDMTKNPENEKIIADAEKSIINKKSDASEIGFENILLLKNELKEDSENVLVLKNEFIDKSIVKENNSLSENFRKTLVLEDGFLDEEANNLNELESNYIHMNEKLKSLNTRQEEKIKDLNILLDKFTSKERYKDLDKKIKLYQEDNALLRNKILDLSDKETALRFQLSDLVLEKGIKEQDNISIKTTPKEDQREIGKLNTRIENLLQKNSELETEILILRKNRTSGSADVDQKIKFYREEHAKIILDKSDIERKLENTKNQLSINKSNKQELKIALDNLNKILANSNVETTTFVNKINIDKTESLKNSEEANNLKELESNYIHMNEKLKSLNTRQEEKIKDLNILLDKFRKRKI